MAIFGTSIIEFDAAFPDDASCANHLLQLVSPQWECECKRPVPWKITNHSFRLARHGCGRSRSVTTGTILQRTTYSLRDVFYTFLLFANSNEGVPSTFLQSHMGLSTSSAAGLARKVRLQMALIERSRKLGGRGQIVRIECRLIGRIRTKGRKGKGRARLLLVSDAEAVAACVITKQERRLMVPFLRQVINPDSQMLTSDPAIRAQLCDGGRYKDFESLQVAGTFVDFKRSNSYQYFRHLNRCIKRTYRSVGRETLWLYVKEFQYKFNRANADRRQFWDMVQCFPAGDPAQIAGLRDESNFRRPTDRPRSVLST